MNPKSTTTATLSGAIYIERFSHNSRHTDQKSGRGAAVLEPASLAPESGGVVEAGSVTPGLTLGSVGYSFCFSDCFWLPAPERYQQIRHVWPPELALGNDLFA